MNNLPKHHGVWPQRCGAPRGAGPMNLHWFKAGPGFDIQGTTIYTTAQFVAKCHTRGVTRGGTMPGHRITGGRQRKLPIYNRWYPMEDVQQQMHVLFEMHSRNISQRCRSCFLARCTSYANEVNTFKLFLCQACIYL